MIVVELKVPVYNLVLPIHSITFHTTLRARVTVAAALGRIGEWGGEEGDERLRSALENRVRAGGSVLHIMVYE